MISKTIKNTFTQTNMSLTSSFTRGFSKAPYRAVFVRHGESVWNKEDRYCGWANVNLTERGMEDAADAGRQLKDQGIKCDVVYTSSLNRALQTYQIISEYLDCYYLPIIQNYRLNTVHYGELEGLEKEVARVKYGEDKIKYWKKAFDVAPPKLSHEDPRHPRNDPRYAGVPTSELPSAESLKDCVNRVLPYWFSQIFPVLMEGKTPLVVCHETTLRVIFGHLDKVSDLRGFKVPNGVPYVYEFDEMFRPINRMELHACQHYYIGGYDIP
mmetsp:Transcript_3197/g.2751  ORF Transcript_3197/g.2751 Transcript_3197/m.2751 type:complete len:269 (+) Transcript_3197:73-879(+)|eukprot:CAMPEP_0114583382 /NCGR_PEP_ID=MMETSP0125-20121206/7125_1 /TAXON_ID=485358 ORGANISM="Aristerostoma sp., Strain ATCC 50986" /NCGR_SAMPLE_ID=MMETSP0125 /ASSEMBLY_ACC=CAM_ASM_000245 /LENGTH=268 /DNA_ID=CAMNT_0001776803 /DNA_START=48 /DNA_END=854 /DNA_ORIENTATION=+